MFMVRCDRRLWLVCGIGMLLGCGSEKLEIVPVTGRITLNGGGWPRPGLIYFTASEPAPGFPRLPGMADVDTEGNFRAVTQPDRDGLVPGKYKIALEMWEVPPTMGGPPAKSFIDDKYRVAGLSGLELEVPTDARDGVTFNHDFSPRQ